MYIAIAALAILGLTYVLGLHDPRAFVATKLLVIVCSVCACIALARYTWHRVSMVRKYVDLLCPFCEYPLHGLPPNGRCPECGQKFSRKDLPDAWASAWDDLKLDHERANKSVMPHEEPTERDGRRS